MKWYWIALIVVVSLVVGYMIAKNMAPKSTATTTTSVPSVTTVQTPVAA